MSPLSVVIDTAPPAVLTEAFRSNPLPLWPPAKSVTMPLVAEIPSALTTIGPLVVRMKTSPVPFCTIFSTARAFASSIAIFPDELFVICSAATSVSRAPAEPVPTPIAALITSRAVVAVMSVKPSPESITAPPVVVMTRSLLLIECNLPSRISPVASKSITPVPELMTVSLLIVKVPLPAFRVTLPLVLVMSAWSEKIKPPLPVRTTFPECVESA